MKKTLLIAAILGTTPLASHAVDYSVKGYASFVAGMTTDKNEFRPNIKYGDGVYDQSFDFSPESRVGLQFTAKITDKLSATAQVISRGALDWEPELPWAYLAYQINDNLQVKAGRLKAPFYMFSDYQDVGYALPWISAPRNAYIVPGDYMEGVNFIGNFSTGAIDHTIEVFGGIMDDTGNSQTKQELDMNVDVVGISWASSYDWLTMRFSYTEAVNLEMHSPALDDFNAGLAGFEAAFPGSVDPKMLRRAATDDSKSTFSGIGLKADFEKLFILAELNQLEWPVGIFAHQKRFYATAGYRVTDKFTPYVTFMKNDDTPGGIIPTGNPALDGGLAALSAASDTTGWAIGGRYDLMPNVALKAEYQSQSSDLDYNSEDVADTLRVAVDILF
jgi:hypothetical protein